MTPRIVLAAIGMVAATLLVTSTGVEAQTPTATPTPTASPSATPAIIGTARISGTITSGTLGMAVPEGLTVQLIVLDGSALGAPIAAPVSGGTYAVEVPLAAGRVFIPRLVSEGVEYLGDPVTFAESAPLPRMATRDFRVYGVTREAPDLAIASSTMTVIGIDRERGQLGLLREDLVANPGDRVFIGDAQGVTLRLPAPTGTIEATGDNVDGKFALERGVVTTTVPIRPGKLTSIVTRYVVGYDTQADQYALRVTSPVPAEAVLVRVPTGFVGALKPQAGARRGTNVPAPTQGAPTGRPATDAQVLQVVESEGTVKPGGGIVVELIGLSKAVIQRNPLTERTGALAAAAIAIAIVGGATAVRWRWSRRPA